MQQTQQLDSNLRSQQSNGRRPTPVCLVGHRAADLCGQGGGRVSSKLQNQKTRKHSRAAGNTRNLKATSSKLNFFEKARLSTREKNGMAPGVV